MKGKTREEVHRTIDRCLEQAKRMGYDYFRTNFLLDRDPFQGATADFEFQPEYLDRLDYLVAACRRYGLYIYGTTASYQLGRKEWNTPFQQRAVLKNETLFGVPERRAEWKKLIVKLLTHVNPYTGLAYKDDPAFLCFEFYNEQEISLQSLLRAPESFPASTLSFINAKFIRFLEEKYKTPQQLSRYWGTPVGNFSEVKFHSGKFIGNRAFAGDWQLFCMKNAAACLDFFNDVMREIGCNRYVSQYNFLPSIAFSGKIPLFFCIFLLFPGALQRASIHLPLRRHKVRIPAGPRPQGVPWYRPPWWPLWYRYHPEEAQSPPPKPPPFPGRRTGDSIAAPAQRAFSGPRCSLPAAEDLFSPETALSGPLLLPAASEGG